MSVRLYINDTEKYGIKELCEDIPNSKVVIEINALKEIINHMRFTALCTQHPVIIKQNV